MWDACRLLWSLLIGLFRSRASLEAENLALRQQIIVLRRTVPKRPCFNIFGRLISLASMECFRTFEMPWRWSDLRPSSDGTVLGSEPIGVGGQGLAGEDRRCRSRSAI
jgi:hypothetical protein